MLEALPEHDTTVDRRRSSKGGGSKTLPAGAFRSFPPTPGERGSPGCVSFFDDHACTSFFDNEKLTEDNGVHNRVQHPTPRLAFKRRVFNGACSQAVGAGADVTHLAGKPLHLRGDDSGWCRDAGAGPERSRSLLRPSARSSESIASEEDGAVATTESLPGSGSIVGAQSLSPRLRHPRDLASPESVYRHAVDAYLGLRTTGASRKGRDNDTTRHTTRRANQSHLLVRGLSPTLAQQGSQRFSFRSPHEIPSDVRCGSDGVLGSGAGSSSGPRPPDSVVDHCWEGVPPLLLTPSEWGIGLNGEWVSVRGPQAIQAVGAVSLTWADACGNTLLHLAAQHNDVRLIKQVFKCEKRRKKAIDRRNNRRERVLYRADKWKKNVKDAAPKKEPEKPKLTTKEILKLIKKEQAEEEKTKDPASAHVGDSGGDHYVGSVTTKELPENSTKSSPLDEYVQSCQDWLPLHDNELGRTGACGDGLITGSVKDLKEQKHTRQNSGSRSTQYDRGRGATVVETLRGYLAEAHVRQVVRIAGMYLRGKFNEAEWFHRTAVILAGTTRQNDLLVEIASAHPSGNGGLDEAKAAIQDYAEEERSTADGNFWRDRGIEDALDVNARNRLGETPLILGAQNASVEVVAALLEETDTDVEAKNGDGCTALVMAIMLDKTEVGKLLVAAYVARGLGVDQQTVRGFSALHWAVVRGNADATIDLIDAGASINTGRTEQRQGMWRLPIHKCAEYGSTNCLEILLKAGADPLLEDKMGMTAMHIAAEKNFLEIMRLLSAGGCRAGAMSVNIVSKKNGKTPLHYAVENHQLEAVLCILDDGGRKGYGDSYLRLRNGAGSHSASGSERDEREAEAIKLLDPSQRTKLEMMLAAAAKEGRGTVESGLAFLAEFVTKVFT